MAASYLYFDGTEWDLGQLGGRMLRNGRFSGDFASKSQNGGQLAGFRNRFINGGCRHAQRGSVVMSASGSVLGGCDRFITTVAGTTVSAIALQAYVNAPAATGWAHQIGNVTTTGATSLSVTQRFESANVFDMSSQQATVSVWVYQNTGAPVSYGISIAKANAIDNFGAATNIASSGALSVPTGTWTQISYSTTISDASNGLQIDVQAGGMSALSSKQFYFTNFSFELGAYATPFEMRSVTLEHLLCQRYLPSFNAIGGGNEDIGWGGFDTTGRAVIAFDFTVEPRVAPTGITLSNVAHFALTSMSAVSAVTGVSLSNVSRKMARLSVTGTGTPYAVNDPALFLSTNASAQLLFTGCEL